MSPADRVLATLLAWPAKLIALEADGPHHWRPDVAINDAARDSYLRSRGWLVFRVDDISDTLEEQLCRVVRLIRLEDDWAGKYWARKSVAS